MASGPENPSFASQALAWLAGAIALVGAWLWVHTMGRISKLEDNTVKQKAFDDYVDRAAKDRDERRETEIALFDEIKGQRTHFDERLDYLAKLILERKS